jgi:type II secretory pathway pseudopilin PulG
MKNLRGVTLMELTVIIAIIGIMTVVAMVSLSGAKNSKAVETAAREVAAAVREAQNYAITGKNAKGGCSYSFSYTALSSGYNISGCSDISYTLKNGVLFGAAGGSISFSIPSATTSGGNIEVKKGSTSYIVCVCSSGKIEEKAGSSCAGVC